MIRRVQVVILTGPFLILQLFAEELVKDGALVGLRSFLVDLFILMLHREQISVADLSPSPLLELLLSLFHFLIHNME